MQARVLTASLFGVAATPVIVEADVTGGLPRFTIVGLPDTAVREAADRVRAALNRAGFRWPAGRITVNLAPADLRKAGTGLDLAIAVAVLGAGEDLPGRALRHVALHGELSLGGEVRAARGAFAVALAARQAGATTFLTAPGCAREAALVPGLVVHAVATLPDACVLLRAPAASRPAPVECAVADLLAAAGDDAGPDLADVRGQERARRAIEIAAAGGHNLALFGPPGAGKTLLARRLPGVLPPPSLEEALDITAVASSAGLGTPGGLVTRRPFRAPHHSLTVAGSIGGGAVPRPGEVSLAHGGVLFLDEAVQFRREVLDLLRQPLEEGEVRLTRGGRSARLPGRCLLVVAFNPCPCGWHGDPGRPCLCTPHAVARHRERLSGPLLDRIDLHVEVPRVEAADLASATPGEGSAAVRTRVAAARDLQAARYAGTPWRTNGDLDGAGARRFVLLGPAPRTLLTRAMQSLGLSARAHDRILKVARTIADLAHEAEVTETHIAEAVGARVLDRAGRESASLR